MQRDSTKLPDGEQLSFIPDGKFVSRPVNLERIPALSSTADALEYSCELARTPDGRAIVPKQICGPMGVHKTTWSRICSGEWDLHGRDIRKFDAIVGNDVYLLFLNHQHGYDLGSMRKTLDDKDQQISDLQQRVADQDRVIQILAGARQKGGG